jgi:hypothetical protein
MNRGVAVTLTPDRIERAKQRAARQLKAYPRDRGDFEEYASRISRSVRLEQAACAAEAVAQLNGWTQIPYRTVKAQWDPNSDEPYLKIPNADSKPRQWVLVIGWTPTFWVLGSAYVRDAADLGEWRSDVRRPAYYIHPDDLLIPKVSAD